MAYDLSKVTLGTNGMVQTGAGSFVNANSLSGQGYQMAVNYNSTKDGPATKTTTQPVTNATIQSDPTKPSSSASYQQNQNATSAVGNATNPQANPNDSTIASVSAAFPSLSADMLKGLDQTTLINLALAADQKNQAGKDAQDLKNQQAEAYRTSLAQQDAQYASARAQLQQDRENHISTATQQLAALNSSGGISSDTSGYIDNIHSQYDMAENQLQLQGEQAKAALDAGNADAYFKISQQMSQTVSNVTTNVQNMLAAIHGQDVQAGQFAQTEQDKATTTYSSMLQNLPQPDVLSKLPTDISKLSADQVKTLQSTSAYQQGVKAGMTPQAILNDVQSAATNSKIAIAKQKADEKTANDVARAAIAASVAQTNAANKQSAAISTANAQAVPSTKTGTPSGGQDFIDAFNAASASASITGKTYDTNLENLSSAISSGNITQAKTLLINYALSKSPSSDVTMINGLRDISGVIPDLKTRIASLPAGLQTGFLHGNIQTLAEKFGQNPYGGASTDGLTDAQKTNLAQLGAEFQHLQKIYVRSVFGMRAASSNSSSIFNSILPSIKNVDSLNLADLEGLNNTANDMVSSTLSNKIGSDNYKNIFGDGGVLSASNQGNVATPPKTFNIGGMEIPLGGSFTYRGATYHLGADGIPVKQ